MRIRLADPGPEVGAAGTWPTIAVASSGIRSYMRLCLDIANAKLLLKQQLAAAPLVPNSSQFDRLVQVSTKDFLRLFVIKQGFLRRYNRVQVLQLHDSTMDSQHIMACTLNNCHLG